MVVSFLLSALNVRLRWSLINVVCFQSGFNQLEETSQMQYGDDVLAQADCKDSALTAMDGSLDGGYTISVKNEDEKQNLSISKEETLRIIEPRHWTVNDRGVLVNADESEVTVKVEKPDWTVENVVIADCSTIIGGQGDNETKDGIVIVKEEDSLSSDHHAITVGH